MSNFNPNKLFVEFRKGVTPTQPVIPRKYTLTHSDVTGDLFLTLGTKYAYDKINPMRDEVLGGWVEYKNKTTFHVHLHVDGKLGNGTIFIRDKIFRRELPLALKAIRYGDRKFFMANPKLNYVPIIVHFKSKNPNYNKVENWGSFSQYEYNKVNVVNRQHDEDIYIEHSSEIYDNKLDSDRNDCVYVNNTEEAKNDNEKIKNNKEDDIKYNLILTLLNPYIEKEIRKLYGEDKAFCLKEVKLQSIEVIDDYNPCFSSYDVFVGLKVGYNPTPYNNFIIQFVVSPNDVITKRVINPRG